MVCATCGKEMTWEAFAGHLGCTEQDILDYDIERLRAHKAILIQMVRRLQAELRRERERG